MKQTPLHRLTRMAGALAVLLALLALASPAALAHERGRSRRGDHRSHGRDTVVVVSRHHHAPAGVVRGHRHRPAHIVAPRHIVVHRDLDYYRPYQVRRYYHAPRRCWHTVYNFPVFVDGRVVYRPYLYEDGRLVVGARFGGPDFSFGFTWVGR